MSRRLRNDFEASQASSQKILGRTRFVIFVHSGRFGVPLVRPGSSVVAVSQCDVILATARIRDQFVAERRYPCRLRG
jgi:hypothetical protein